MNSVCFYHRADLDGKCSGAIVKYYDPDVKLISFDYNEPFPWEEIKKDTKVYMVDLSLDNDDMYKLNKKCMEFIYIDHHISKLSGLDLSQFEGLQVDGVAACELTWKHLISENNIPTSVRLLSRYDTWDLDPNVLAFQYGVRALNLDPNDTKGWIKNIFDDIYTPQIIRNGEVILKYVEMTQEETVKRTGFHIQWGGYDVLAMNITQGSSLLFKGHLDYLNADILMVFGWTGKIWKISLYTTKKHIDVSKIAMEYRGGGHRQAAGFVCNELPFQLGET